MERGGMRTRLYDIWNNMKQRCLNTHRADYRRYGGRGIKVCKEWMNFKNFEKWAISNGYSNKLTLDRVDNNGNYEPINCRWANDDMQRNNKRTSHFVTYNGKTQTIKQWANELGINYYTLHSRINKRHWDIVKALKKP